MTDTRETAEALLSAWMNKWRRVLVAAEFPDLADAFAAALRKERAEVWEEAAKVADERRDHWRERSKQEVEHKTVCDIRANMADTIAARIRARAEKEVQG